MVFTSSATARSNVGSYEINGTGLTANLGNYIFKQAPSNATALTIDKATATITVNGYSGTYDAAPHGATGSATGVLGETLAGLDLGASFTNVPGDKANWTFSNANYLDQSGAVDIVINKAVASISVIGTIVTYDGHEHGASGTATGVNSEPLTGLVFGEKFINVPGGTANWTFSNANYTDQSGEAEIVINKAVASISVIGTTVTYDGHEHGASGTATGVNSEPLTGLVFGEKFINVPGGTANWTFSNANYTDQSGKAEIVINKANATIAVNGFTGTYDGLSHGASGSATGISGEILEGLNLGASFTNVPGGTANWVFTDETGNYNDASGSASVSIGKANAEVGVSGYTGIYDGAAHGANGSAKGVLGETLTGLNLGDSFSNVPGGTANWVFTDATGNYNDASGSVSIEIGKADATITIADYKGTYDAVAHTASGIATGVGGADLSSGLTFATSHTDAPGGQIAWSFAGGINYKDASGTANVNIDKANATIEITDYKGSYDAAEHTASGTVTGVGNVDLSAGLSFATSYTDAPGGETAWSFAGGTNYNDASGMAAVMINPRDITLKADPKTKVQGSPDPEFTYKMTGSLVAGDHPTLTRDKGEDVGVYAIKHGGLGNNYNITYVGADLTITPLVTDGSGGSATKSFVIATPNKVNRHETIRFMAHLQGGFKDGVMAASKVIFKINDMEVGEAALEVIGINLTGSLSVKLDEEKVAAAVTVGDNVVTAVFEDGDSNLKLTAPYTIITVTDEAISGDLEAKKQPVFDARLLPNPSSMDFGLQFENANNDPIEVTVLEINTGILKEKFNTNAEENKKFGFGLGQGIYLVVVRQGSNQVVLRAMKL